MDTVIKHPSNLIVPVEAFSENRIKQQAEEFGYAQANTLEALIWDYELYAQVQRRAPESCRLRGGAAVQLYVPKERQRASIDVDILTTMPKRDFQRLLNTIADDYGMKSPYLQFEPYQPEDPAELPGLSSYTTFAPTSLGQTWEMQDGTVIEARMIKLDVHEVSDIPEGEIRDGVAIGIDLGFQPLCVSRGYLFAEKLLTQARNTIGVPDNRYQDLPKHLYDLNALLQVKDATEALGEALEWLPSLINEQGDQWQSKNAAGKVLEDLENSLLEFAVIDYSDERGRYSTAVQRLETLYLSSGNRLRLHRWALMAARALSIIRLFRRILEGDENLSIRLYLQAEQIAEQVRSHPNPAKLARLLFNELSESLRRTRELRGSPPERLFWLINNWHNLNEIEGILSVGD